MRFFLTGFMGCGKSFWGHKMATLFKMPFIDLDDHIEEKEGNSISEIFTSKGELYFRELERKYLEGIIHGSSYFIMATGGGTPCFYENMKWMNESGVSIYLKATTNYLKENILRDSNKRPLLNLIEPEKLHQFIEEKLEERKIFYEMARHIIDTNSMDETIFADLISNYV